MANTLRSCIVAEQGYTFIALDASQIELRVVALLSQDPAMIADTKTSDLHRATAVRVFGEPSREEAIQALSNHPVFDDVSNEIVEEAIKDWLKTEMKSRRYKAKQLNFAILYGAEAFKIAQMADCSEDEAEELIRLYFVAYPVLSAWIQKVKDDAKQNGFVTNLFGRIRPIPELLADSGLSWKIKSKYERECVNTKVQGTAVDIVKMAMLYMRRLYDPAIRLVLNVHDEMVWECPDSLLSLALEQCKELEGAFPDYPFSLKIGKVYGEIKEVEKETVHA